MHDFQLVLLIFAAFLSIIPVIELYRQRKEHQFAMLSVLMTLVFAWSLNMIIKYTLDNLVISYYVHLTLFPIIFLITYFFLRTVYSYIDQRPPKWLVRIMPFIFMLHLGVTMTNDLHQWMLPFTSTTITNKAWLFDIHHTPMFSVHILISYFLLLYGIVKFFNHYRNMAFKKHLQRPFLFFVVSIIIALILNAFHLYIYTLYVDPTYFSAVLFSYGLYHFMYKRDFYYALLQEGRKTILDGMREYYVLTTDTGSIIEISPSMQKKFKLKKISHVHELLAALKKHVNLYEDIDKVEDRSDERPYYYTNQKRFTLSKFNIEGKLYLFYDETKFVRLINQLEESQNHDIMTGLYNRNFLENNYDYFDKEFPYYGLLLADINGLKLFNDNFGHRSGDDLIKRFADQLNGIQTNDTVIARSGGDEFVVVVKRASAMKLEKMRDRLIKACWHEDPLKEISISVGISLRESQKETFEAVFKRADQNLYTMKDITSQDYQNRLTNRIKEKTKSS